MLRDKYIASHTCPILHRTAPALFFSYPTHRTFLTSRQVTREESILVNIMRDVPRQDTQPENHAQLLLCLYKPFFKIHDLRLPDEASWAVALRRTEESGLWDQRSTSMRINIKGMLRQRHAADEEIARRRQEVREASAAGNGACGGADIDGDIFGADVDDTDPAGPNVMPPARNAHRVSAYVNNAVDRCLDAGFSRTDNDRLPQAALLSGRSSHQIAADASKVRQGQDAITAKSSIARQNTLLKTRETEAATAAPDDAADVAATKPYNADALSPYLRDLRSKSQTGLSKDAKDNMDRRRKETNEAVAKTDVGRSSPQQHDAVRRIADEFGLNRKQRLAFFIFGAAWIARDGVPTPNALRLHVSGGAGSGKSYVLRAIVALIGCPPLKGVVQPGGLLTVAFQGKAAANVGGNTVHSVADVPRKNNNGAMDNTIGQTGLSEAKAARWTHAAALAIEEVSMVSCLQLGSLHKAAVSVRPSSASLPFAGMICVTFGDLNQVCSFRCLQTRLLPRPANRIATLPHITIFETSSLAVALTPPVHVVCTSCSWHPSPPSLLCSAPPTLVNCTR